ARLGDEEEQRIRGALELERPSVRRVRVEIEAVAEPERLGPLAVGRAEVADETRGDGQVGAGEGLQERPRAALPEEAARVRDREPVAAAVLEAGEVVEVAAVRDGGHLAV